MKPPLERAARALCSLAGNPENATMNGKPLWMDYLPEARAVIEAIRGPSEYALRRSTEERAKAAIHLRNAPDDIRQREIELAGWQAIVSEMLAEGE